MEIIHFVAITDLKTKKIVYHSPNHTLDAIKNEYKSILKATKTDTRAIFNLRIVYSNNQSDESLTQRDSYFDNAIYYHDFNEFKKTLEQTTKEE